MPKIQETLPVLPVSHAAQNVSILSNFDESKNPLRMWVFSEGMKGIDGFVSLINSQKHRCERYLHADTLRIRISATVTDLRGDPPDLLWIALSPMTTMNAQSKAALKLFAHEQLRAGKHVIWEGATFDKQDNGFVKIQNKFNTLSVAYSSRNWKPL